MQIRAFPQQGVQTVVVPDVELVMQRPAARQTNEIRQEHQERYVCTFSQKKDRTFKTKNSES